MWSTSLDISSGCRPRFVFEHAYTHSLLLNNLQGFSCILCNQVVVEGRKVIPDMYCACQLKSQSQLTNRSYCLNDDIRVKQLGSPYRLQRCKHRIA